MRKIYLYKNNFALICLEEKGKKMKSIVVDDDKICGNIFKTELSKFGQCDFVDNGKTALEAYQQSIEQGVPYQLMVLDIIMPDMDGGEVLRSIRRIESEKNIWEMDRLRVVITTAYDDWYNRKIIISKLNCIYENYFIKSSDMNEFLDKVHELGFVLED